jgi:predicted RND superfamily exporter protein
VKLILYNYPVKSIKDIKGGKPWDYKFIKIGGQTYSLNNIEHDILRKDFFDSRLHFVLVCAAKSCPKLLDKAYIPQNLNAEMTNQANSFINNSAKNKISAGSAQISELFNWYKDDFLKVSGVNSIQDYLNKYSTTKVKSTTPIKYMTYDWSLND